VRVGFVAALIDPRSGSVTAACGARFEAAWLWAVERGTLLLATEPGSLLECQAEPAIDHERSAQYLTASLPSDSTVYRGIRRVPVGHLLSWRPGTSPRVRRWSRPWEVEPLPPHVDAGALMREAVRDAVDASLPRDAVVVAQLSGGLDSTMVVATAAHLLADRGDRLRTASHVTVPWPDWLPPEADDAPVVEAFLAAVPGVEGHRLVNDGRSPLDSLRELIGLTSFPFLNPSNAPWVGAVEAWARSQGATVMLTGHHGSVGFSVDRGSQYGRALARGRLRLVTADARARHASGDGVRHIAHDVLHDLAPGAVRRWRRLRLGADGERSMPPYTRLVTDRETPRQPRGRGWFRESVLLDPVQATLGQSPVGAAWTSDPLGDPEVLRLLFALPPDAWLGRGRGRDVARRAQEGLVPDTVRLRTARGLQGVDVSAAVAAHQDDYRRALDQVADSELARRFVDVDALRGSMTPGVPVEGPESMRWQLIEGRVLGFGLFLVWFEDYLRGRRA